MQKEIEEAKSEKQIFHFYENKIIIPILVLFFYLLSFKKMNYKKFVILI